MSENDERFDDENASGLVLDPDPDDEPGFRNRAASDELRRRRLSARRRAGGASLGDRRAALEKLG